MQKRIPSGNVRLRRTQTNDLEWFFAFQRERAGRTMLGFGPPDPNDREDFDEKWSKHLSNPDIFFWTILFQGEQDTQPQVAGHIATFYRDGYDLLEVGYLLGQNFWGKGVASAALELVLGTTAERPVGARCIVDNAASMRVLEKQGFREIGREWNFAHARGEQVEERLFRLD